MVDEIDTNDDLAMIDRYYHSEEFEQCMRENPFLRGMGRKNAARFLRRNFVQDTTSFLRNYDIMLFFGKEVLPEYDDGFLLADMGCSNGRNSYMFLVANWNKRDKFELEAFDNSQRRINQARENKYKIHNKKDTELSHNHVGQGRNIDIVTEMFPILKEIARIRIYENSGTGYVSFNRDVTERIRFNVWDIMDKPLEKPRDGISCFNVMEHYPDSGKERIISNLRESLRPGGWLFLENRNPESYSHQIQLQEWLNRNMESFGFEDVGYDPHAYLTYLDMKQAPNPIIALAIGLTSFSPFFNTDNLEGNVYRLR